MYGHELSRMLEMNRQFEKRALARTTGLSKTLSAHQQDPPADHESAKESQRYQNKSQGGALADDDSEDHAHQNGDQADNDTVPRARS